MPAIVVPKDGLALGPGYLLWAPLLSTLPAMTVAGSVFTDVWPGAWLPFGITDAGSEFDYSLSIDEVDAEEYLDPIAYTTTKRAISVKFAMANLNLANYKRALNGGIITVTGSAGTQLNKFAPPTLGAEVRAMIGWESTDATERFVAYQTLQIGSIAIPRKKGASKAIIPVEYKFEQPPSGDPYNHWTAGTVRG